MCFVRQNKGIRRFLGPPAAFWAVLGLTAASWSVLGGYPGSSCGILGLPLGSPVASSGLLRDSGCLLHVSGASRGFLGPAAAFLGSPAVFWASCGFQRLRRAGVLVGLLRVSGASCGFLGTARVPASSYGLLGPACWSGCLASRKPQNAALSWNPTDSQSVSCSTGIVLLNN